MFLEEFIFYMFGLHKKKKENKWFNLSKRIWLLFIYLFFTKKN